MTSSTTHTTTNFKGQTLSVVLPKPLKIVAKHEPKPTKPVIQAEVVMGTFIMFLIGINILIGSQATKTYQPKTAGAISSGVSEAI